MSRACKQLTPIRLDVLAPDAADLLWTDSRLQFGSADAAEPDIAVYQSALVIPRSTPDARRCLLWLQSVIRGVDVRIAESTTSASMARELREAQAADCDIRTAVLVLDEASTEAAHVQAMVDAVRDGPDTVTTVVVVASEPHRWSGLHGVDGVFRAVAGQEARTGAQVFAALASMGAPMLYDCLDLSEVLPVLGSVDAPSHVCTGQWMRRQQALVMSSARDEDVLRSARALVSFVFPQRDSIATCERIRNAIRELSPGVEYRAGSLPSRFLVPPVEDPDAIPVIVFCSS